MTAPAASRPTTCGSLFTALMAESDRASGEGFETEMAAKGCKRLPRHGGDHRAFLTVRAANKAAKAPVAPKGRKTGRKLTVTAIKQVVSDIRTIVGVVGRKRMTATQRRLAFVELQKLIDSGKLSTSTALGVAAKLA